MKIFTLLEAKNQSLGGTAEMINDEYILIESSGYFDAEYYLETYPDVKNSNIDPILHFIKYGWKEGRNPSQFFNTTFYIETNLKSNVIRANPLVHYINYGKKEGLATSSSYSGKLEPIFETRKQLEAYRSKSPFNKSTTSIRIRFWKKKISNGLFSIKKWGFIATLRILLRKIGVPTRIINWLFSYSKLPSSKTPYFTVYKHQLEASTGVKRDGFVEYEENDAKNISSLVKLIAFYLPQYHPFPENDRWWGKGFTEWTNVSKAVPQFVGHIQPRLPGELGFYDLRVPEIQHRQIELAENYGIHGFCFHYYWFGGKRLLEKPLDQFISDPNIEFPFCICWANENWTRAWDGRSSEVLIRQTHSFEYDSLIIKDLMSLFEKPNYIRINGRPLIIVYRSDILQDAKETLEFWREYSISHGAGNPYILMAQTFDVSDPQPYGFDGAVEFPPHNRRIIEEITPNLKILNPDYDGRVYRYEDLSKTAIDDISLKPYNRFNTVVPGWDNEARRPGKGNTYFGSTPALYADWLRAACKFAVNQKAQSERFVFINAWNEWAEGAYLEPDRYNGYAYLQATKKVLDEFRNPSTD
jgi:hypothetical protein